MGWCDSHYGSIQYWGFRASQRKRACFAPVQERHQISKAEEHHDVHADPHAVEARGRPRVRAGVGDVAAGIWAVGGCGLGWGLALVNCHWVRCSVLLIRPFPWHDPRVPPSPRTTGVVAHDQPDEGAEGLEGKEGDWKHAAAAASARHGPQLCVAVGSCCLWRRGPACLGPSGEMWRPGCVLGWGG